MSFLPQGIAVEQRRRRGRRARGPDQDGRDGAAVHGATVKPQKHTDRYVHVHAEAERNQQSHTHGRRQAGDGADQDAAQGASEDDSQMGWLEHVQQSR